MNDRSTGPCPQCGGPLGFKLKASVQCVCPYCGSLVVRRGEALARFGTCADLLEGVSPLRVGTTGIHHQRSFEIVGRRQIRWDAGFWEEWYVAYGKSEYGWLTDAQGSFAFLRPAPSFPANVDERSRPGHVFRYEDQVYGVVDVKKARVSALEGELPEAYEIERPFLALDAANDAARLCTLEFGASGKSCYVGQYVNPEFLELRNTREDADGWR